MFDNKQGIFAFANLNRRREALELMIIYGKGQFMQ